MSPGATIGQTLLVSAVLLYLLPVPRFSAILRSATLVVCVGISFFRIGGLSLIAYPSGLLGDLSITTQILLACSIASRLTGVDVLPDRDRSFLLTTAAVSGLLLYPLSSGLTGLDLYSWGFGSGVLMIGLALATFVSWCFRPVAAVMLLLGVVAFDLNLLASTNIWDYLLDPALVLFAWGWRLVLLMRRFRAPSSSLAPGTAEASQP